MPSLIVDRDPATGQITSGPHAQTVKAEFIALFAELGNAEAARKELAIPHRTLYQWKADDPEFAAEWAARIQGMVDHGTGTLYRRGTAGKDDMPAFLSLIAWLKAHDPQHYIERHIVVTQESPAQAVLGELLARLRARGTVVEGTALPEPPAAPDKPTS